MPIVSRAGQLPRDRTSAGETSVSIHSRERRGNRAKEASTPGSSRPDTESCSICRARCERRLKSAARGGVARPVEKCSAGDELNLLRGSRLLQGSVCQDGPEARRCRLRASRRRKLSPFASRMWQRCVRRSSAAPVSRSLPSTSVHCSKGRFVVTIRLCRS